MKWKDITRIDMGTIVTVTNRVQFNHDAWRDVIIGEVCIDNQKNICLLVSGRMMQINPEWEVQFGR